MRLSDTPTDEQISKLPKWAREYITVLAYAASDAQHRLEEHQKSVKPTRLYWTSTHSLDDNPVYLGDARYDTICYDMTRDEVAVKQQADGRRPRDIIEINRGSTFFSNGRRERMDTTLTLRGGDGRLVVEPKATNEFIVHYIDRWTDHTNG